MSDAGSDPQHCLHQVRIPCPPIRKPLSPEPGGFLFEVSVPRAIRDEGHENRSLQSSILGLVRLGIPSQTFRALAKEPLNVSAKLRKLFGRDQPVGPRLSERGRRGCNRSAWAFGKERKRSKKAVSAHSSRLKRTLEVVQEGQLLRRGEFCVGAAQQLTQRGLLVENAEVTETSFVEQNPIRTGVRRGQLQIGMFRGEQGTEAARRTAAVAHAERQMPTLRGRHQVGLREVYMLREPQSGLPSYLCGTHTQLPLLS